MSTGSQLPGESQVTRGWRGRRSPSVSVPRHDWQQGQHDHPQKQQRARDRSRRFRLLFLLLLFGVLFAFFVNRLLFAPRLTPMLVIAATEYEYPLPPNAWAYEDIEALQALDQRSLTMVDGGEAWRSMDELKEKLRLTAGQASRGGTAIVYVAMHGVTALDGDSRPAAYLVPPDASPLLPSTWLPLRDLLSAIRQTMPPDVKTLLILDAVRLQSHWDMGLVYNRFAELLPEEVAAAGGDNLAVLTSADVGQRAWWDPELRGSVFGYYFRRGLAGEADSEPPGNRDRLVSLSELTSYLARHVDQWSRANRGARQYPRLIDPGQFEDQTLAWAIRGTLPPRPPAPPAVVDRGIETTRLWQRRDELQELEFTVSPGEADGRPPPAPPNRFNPLAWRDLEKRLLWLEQASVAGKAYTTKTDRLWRQLQDRTLVPDRDSGIRGYWRVLLETAPQTAPDFALHTLPLNDFFGMGDVNRAATSRRLLDDLQQDTTPETLQSTSAQLAELAIERSVPEMSGSVLVRTLHRYSTSLPWDRPGLLRDHLRVRETGDRAAVPGDERGHYWIRGTVRKADNQRRLAADRLLGVSSNGTDDDRSPAAAEATYRQAESRAEMVADALHLRDEFWARVTYLARWYSLPPASSPDVARIERYDEQMAPRFENALLAAVQLDEALNHRDGEASLHQIEVASAQLRENLGALNRGVLQEFRNLTSSGAATPSARRLMDELLALPLLSAGQRIELQEAKVRFLPAELDGRAVARDERAPDASSFMRRFQDNWKRHPALMVLDAANALREFETEPAPKTEKSVAEATIPERDGARLRAGLLAVPNETFRLCEGVRATVAETREARFAADHMVRATAGIWYPQPLLDPTAALRDVDLYELLVWQARRSLDDFTGLVSTGNQPFFKAAAINHLQAARSFLVPGEEEQERVRQWVDQYERAARSGLATSVDVGTRLEVTEPLPVEVSVSVDPQVVQGLRGSDAPDGPLGFAAVMIRGLNGTPISTAPPVAIAERSQGRGVPVPLLLPADRLAVAGSMLESVAVFRGHEFTTPFDVEELSGRRVVSRLREPTSTRLLVEEPPGRERSVILILDCSRSMEAELADADGRNRSRMEIAKSALQSMVDQLAEESQVRAGVLFFGHRIAWSTDRDQPVEALRQTEYDQAGVEIPGDLMPSQDVESIVDLGRFDIASAARVRRHLQGVKAWGQTPLYLSIQEAFRQFARDDTDTEKSIVVVTDGANNQFTPVTSPVRPEPTGAAEIEAALQQQKIPIYVVAFAVPENERATARRQFDALAEMSGGRNLDVDEAPALIKTLRGLLGRKTFTVRDPQGTEAGTVPGQGVPGPAPLGTWLSIDSLAGAEAPFRVVVDDSVQTTVVVPRGRWLEFALAANRRELQARPYEANVVTQGYLANPGGGEAGRLVVRAHRPVFEGSRLRIPLSFQQPGELVTADPTSIWIEVTPLLADGVAAAAPYTLYDSNYEPHTPVPVLVCTLDGWPANATAALLRVSIKSDATPPTVEEDLARLTQADEFPDAAVTLEEVDGMPGRRYEVLASNLAEGGLRIAVVEKLVDSALPWSATKIALTSPSGLVPERTVRRFDRSQRMTTHAFYFTSPGAAVGLREGGLTLHITSRAALLEGASSLPDRRPLRIEVFGENNLLELNPARR